MLYDRQDSSSSKQAPGQPQQAWIQLSVKDMLMIKTYDQSGPTVASIINVFYCAQHPVAKVQLDNLVHAPFAGSGGGGGGGGGGLSPAICQIKLKIMPEVLTLYILF